MRTKLELDIECYRDYFLVKFRNATSGNVRDFEMYDGHPLDTNGIKQCLRQFEVYTFNGNDYDMPMLHYALKVCIPRRPPIECCRMLKTASDYIIDRPITDKLPGWLFMQTHGLQMLDFIDHVDLMNVAFGDGSLKIYGGRLHSKRMQDLPIEPDESISPEQRELLRTYCGNDLMVTADLRRHLTPQLQLREHMTATYGVDLRSKSDAQIAEAVFRSEMRKVIGAVNKADILPGTVYQYTAPSFVEFESPDLQVMLEEIQASEFVINYNGSPIEPPALADREVRIGSSVYRMGIGGLHSSEQSTAHEADAETFLLDRDVASYYPAIILRCGLFPKHLSSEFLGVYRSIFERRLAAKRSGDKTSADTLKIVLNGSFGKFGNKHSVLYAPDLMIQTTVTGQLCLLMLIEMVEDAGFSVVSANTDGIVIKGARSRNAVLDEIVKEWERRTGFETEETRYLGLYSRDINNYIAVKAHFDKASKSWDETQSGGVKGKGAYGEVSLSKNPKNQVSLEAVYAYLEFGLPVNTSVIAETDIRKFLTVRRVTGGAIKILESRFNDSLTPGQKKRLLLEDGWQVAVDGPLSKLRLTRPELAEPLDVDLAYRHACGADVVEYIGKAVRFYYAAGVTDGLRYKVPTNKGNHNLVPDSAGAMPLMELPDRFPSDVNFDHYIGEANRILKDIGAL